MAPGFRRGDTWWWVTCSALLKILVFLCGSVRSRNYTIVSPLPEVLVAKYRYRNTSCYARECLDSRQRRDLRTRPNLAVNPAISAFGCTRCSIATARSESHDVRSRVHGVPPTKAEAADAVDHQMTA
jgi:hypothetical protein